jgi:hypothetical protein
MRYRHVVQVELANAPDAFKPLSAGRAYIDALGIDFPTVDPDGEFIHELNVALSHVDADSYDIAHFPAAAKLRLQAVVSHTRTKVSDGSVEVNTYTTTVAANGFAVAYSWAELSSTVDVRDVNNLVAPADRAALALRGGALPEAAAPLTSNYRFRLSVQLLNAAGGVGKERGCSRSANSRFTVLLCTRFKSLTITAIWIVKPHSCHRFQ